MAIESIGAIYSTKIPGYADNADVQVALRLYHYGSATYDTTNTNVANLVNPSIAYTLNNLQTQITAITPVDVNIIDAKGDLLIGSANNAVDNLTVGSNNYVLTADSTQTLGVKWAAPTNLTGPITSVGAATSVASQTGTGTKFVMDTNPALIAPALGVATGTSFNSITGLSSTTPVIDGTATIGVGTTAARGDHIHPTDTSRAALASPTFTGTVTIPNGAVLGTPTSATLTNATGLPVSGITASTSTALGVGSVELGHASDTTIARVSAGVVSIEGNAVLVSGGALGTPSSGTLTNASGLLVSGITASTSTALGVGSVELGHATDTTIARASAGVVSIEGNAVLVSGGALGTPTSATLTNATGYTVGNLASAGTGVVTALGVAVTGSGGIALGTGPTITLPVINNLKLGYATTATAAGTTTLTSASANQQFFTGTTTQTVKLPVTSTLVTGMSYRIVNNSTGILTVQSSGLNTITTVASDSSLIFTCIGITLTTAADWDYDSTSSLAIGSITGLGTGIATALAINTGTAGAPVINGGALGTPSGGTLTNATGYTVGNLASAGTGVVTALGVAVTGSGGIVLATSPTIASPKISSTYTAKTAAYTFSTATGDEGNTFSMNNAASVQFNIPTDATSNFAVGTEINVFWITGAGQPTIGAVTPGTTTVISTGATSATPKLRVANSGATIKKYDANKWIVFGDIT